MEKRNTNQSLDLLHHHVSIENTQLHPHINSHNNTSIIPFIASFIREGKNRENGENEQRA